MLTARLAAYPRLWWATALLLGLALVLGGAARQGLWSDAVIQIYSLLALGLIAAKWQAMPQLSRLSVVLLGGLMLLPLLQLVPLPAFFWSVLPGRGAIAADYTVVGMPLPWLPVSLTPERTWRAALALLPGFAMFFATLALDSKGRRGLGLLIVVLAMASVLLGLAQIAQGPASPLRLQSTTNASVGFFANRNHYAALLCCAIPVAATWLIISMLDRRSERIIVLALSIIVYASLLVGLAAAQSRAGIFLGVLAGLGSVGLALVQGRRFARFGALVIGGAWLIGLLLIIQYAVLGILGRFEQDVLDDFRFEIARVTLQAILAFQPFGSGIGTFDSIYRMFETPDVLLQPYVNHAHNEWLELALEGGIPAIVLLAAFLFWFGSASLSVWRQRSSKISGLDLALARAATIIVTILVLHSTVDYPLRTTALMVLFGWACALLADPFGRNAQPAGMSGHTRSDGGRHRRWKELREWERRSAGYRSSVRDRGPFDT